MTSIEFTVLGKPTGKGRPRFVKATGRAFTPADTLRAEQRVQLAWMEAGRPRLHDGPIHAQVEVVVNRPQGHWKRDGTLSAAGTRAPWPTSKPDLDNVLKLVGDALNGHAYKDDAHITDARIVRRWANPGEHEHLHVTLTEIHAAAAYQHRAQEAA